MTIVKHSIDAETAEKAVAAAAKKPPSSSSRCASPFPTRPAI